MSIIGILVKHKLWGNGIIEDRHKDMLYVRFSGTSSKHRIIKFQLPDAFRKKHLMALDDTAEERIEQLLAEYQCTVCKTDLLYTEPIDGKRYCMSCKSKNAKTCPYCGKAHMKDGMVPVIDQDYFYGLKYICKKCAEAETYVCGKCKSRYAIEYEKPHTIKNILVCDTCYKRTIRTCSFCNQRFDLDDGDVFRERNEPVYVCPDCLELETVICQSCNQRKLNSMIVASKYIATEELICTDCAKTCVTCETAMQEKDARKIFGKLYCPDCVKKHMKECAYCYEDFMPTTLQQEICPECDNAEKYIERLQKLDFSACSYQELNYYTLESIDRCELFTNLYKSYLEDAGIAGFNNIGKPRHLLIMRFRDYKLVITYLPKTVTDKVLHSCNVTMTEFRKRDGAHSVYKGIKEWLDTSSQYIQTPAGKVRILLYPVLLRVQTEFDKYYGKEWNGPGDYIEIGNYGDTTNFYIIGILEK